MHGKLPHHHLSLATLFSAVLPWAFRVISGMGDCTGPLLLHVATEKIVEGGPDYRDRSELADRFPAWSHRS
jgi:hypothetical protein